MTGGGRKETRGKAESSRNEKLTHPYRPPNHHPDPPTPLNLLAMSATATIDMDGPPPAVINLNSGGPSVVNTSATADLNSDQLFTCLNCGVAFHSPDEQREHMTSDWHRYNMKVGLSTIENGGGSTKEKPSREVEPS